MGTEVMDTRYFLWVKFKKDIIAIEYSQLKFQ